MANARGLSYHPAGMQAALTRWGRRHGARILTIAFFTPAALLFIPVLRYSLDTPFALVDDYADWKYSVIFTSPALFRDWIDFTFLGTDVLRYRPFWDFYNAAAWSVFGTNPWLHHLSRWIFHFAAIFMFAAAFLQFASAKGEGGTDRTWMLPAIPMAFLVYVWLFFPNSPASRLSPQEVYTVFFLGICTLAVALTLKGGEVKGWIRSGGMKYSLFLLGYTGLVLSKEVNLAVAFWIMLAYIVYVCISTGRRRKLIGAIPLVFLFAFTSFRVYVASGNYDSGVSSGSFTSHAEFVFLGLFQAETSLLVTAVFLLLTGMAAMAAIIRFFRRRRDGETLFLLFLIGQVVSIYFVTIFSFWDITLRYWYPILPGLALMMAFSVKYIIIYSRCFSPWISRAVSSAILSFIVFFLAINYYNFSSQTLFQHSARSADSAILAELSRLPEERNYVYSHGFTSDVEQEYSLFRYFTEYQPFFRGDDRETLTWKGWPDVLAISFSSSPDALHRFPPDNPGKQYYFVNYVREDTLLDFLDVHQSISGREDYAILSHARTLAGFLQQGTPHVSIDDGSPTPGRYRWAIYRVPFGDPMDRAIDSLRATYERAITREPDVRSNFTIYSSEDRLVYVREHCAPEDTAGIFILHPVPFDRDDLPDERRRHGFDNLDFRFGARGARFDGRCVASVGLPDYAIASVRTGQYTDDGMVWSVEFVPGLAGFLRTAYEQAVASVPVARSTFDLYAIENQLVYVREQCAPEDTRDWFFLHLTPVDTGDLPSERRRHGFDNLDFRFTLRGMRFDGRCVAAMPLPDYAIAGVRTGQYGDGGELWSVEFAPER